MDGRQMAHKHKYEDGPAPNIRDLPQVQKDGYEAIMKHRNEHMKKSGVQVRIVKNLPLPVRSLLLP